MAVFLTLFEESKPCSAFAVTFISIKKIGMSVFCLYERWPDILVLVRYCLWNWCVAIGSLMQQQVWTLFICAINLLISCLYLDSQFASTFTAYFKSHSLLWKHYEFYRPQKHHTIAQGWLLNVFSTEITQRILLLALISRLAIEPNTCTLVRRGHFFSKSSKSISFI